MCYCFPEEMVMNLDVSLHKTIVIITNLQIRKSLLCQVSECRQAVSTGCAVCGLPQSQLSGLAGSHDLSRPIRGRTNQATNQKPVMRSLQIYKFKMNGLIASCLNSPLLTRDIISLLDMYLHQGGGKLSRLW